MEYTFMLVTLAVLGLLFGSFANVVIWRFPRKESLSVPGSHCPRCEHPIRWYDNIPVISWVLLRARCRDCGIPISWRYPFVELLSSALWLSAGLAFGLTYRTPVAVALFYLLMILAFIDMDTMRLPNPLVGLLAAIGAVAAVVSQVVGVRLAPLIGAAESGLLSRPLASALLGAVLGGGVVWSVAGVYQAARKRSGLGFGDVKLLAAMGLFLGPYVLLVVFAGSVLGALYGVSAGIASGRGIDAGKIPFAPFLSAGGVLVTLFGPALWDWYSRLVGLS